MGAQDRFGFTVVLPQECIDAEFSHTLRLEIGMASDGTYPGDTGPSHFWCDVHSHYDEIEEVWVRDDVPITAADYAAVRMIQRLAQLTSWPHATLDEIGMAIGVVAKAAWGEAVGNRIRWAMTSGGETSQQVPALSALVAIEAYKGAGAGVTP